MKNNEGSSQAVTAWVFLLGLLFLLLAAPSYAATKIFSGGGTDATLWHDDSNWFATGIPAATDAVTVDKADASVTVKKEFAAQSVTVGGKATSTWAVDPFVYGTITPASTSDPAILIRKNGTVVLKGAGGTVVAKGLFKNTEETLPAQPSVMVVIQ